MAKKGTTTVSEEKPAQGESITENSKQPMEEKREEAAEAGSEMAQPMEEKREEAPEADSETAQPMEELNTEGTKMSLVPPKPPNRYKITCRNRITKQIGGVDFVDGVGYTVDAFAASWFETKDGYIVEPTE